MKKSLALVLVALVLMVIAGGIGYLVTRTGLPSIPAGWVWYHDYENGYSIAHPADWEYFNVMGAYVAGGAQFNDRRTGAGLAVGVLSVEVSLENYIAWYKEVAENVYGENMTFLSERTITVPREGYETVDAQLDNGKIVSMRRTSWFIQKGKLYPVSCSVTDFSTYTTEAAYTMYENTFDKIVNSFVIHD